MKKFVANPMTTPEYAWSWSKRINDNIPSPSQENVRPIKEHLRIIQSELDIVKQDFEKKSSELRKKIEELEEEKIQIGLDIDMVKLERSLHQHRSLNSMTKLKASRAKVEELKRKIEELETAL
ncbi:hypothetical protein Gogos_020899 [Gossypium gossypioides]|uniref:Uncharacterized protein n=1 Tax=Gossypium gossypioides TaxID=34282 RepID=A0A7J9D1D0_GOSGO|nr:hypothetical protein [Gossypium gossypioides]